MSEAKFTKGEWVGFKDGKWQSDYINDYTLDGENNPSWVQVTCNEQAVAIIPNHGCTLDANAHLIATAPAMYAEIEKDIAWLNRMIVTHGDSHPMTIVFSQMKVEKKELLAKARGEK